MKFSIALGLLFAGLAYSQDVENVQPKIDSFLRSSQHLQASAQLVSIKTNGQLATVTYKDGPMSLKYNVQSHNDDMRVVGIEKIVSFSSNFHFQPLSPQDVPQNVQNLQLKPLPLLMPEWTIQPNGEVNSRNVFDEVNQELAEMEKKLQLDRQNFLRMMGQKSLEVQKRLNPNFSPETRKVPLIGAEPHDYNKATDVQFGQHLIGGDHDYNWATQIQIKPTIPIIGGDHDYNWATFQFQPNQPFLRADDHDKIEPQKVIEGYQFQFDHPIVGGDHDNWQKQKGRHHKNLKNQKLIGSGNHDSWKHQNKRHHFNKDWMNRNFNSEEVTPYLKQSLPDMMQNAQIISIKNKGFSKGKGFPLDIQLKDSQGNIGQVSVYFRPRKHELLIDKITAVKNTNNFETGKKIVSKFIQRLDNVMPVEIQTEAQSAKNKDIPTQNLVAPSFIPETETPLLLSEKQDSDNNPQFMKMAKEIEIIQDNHVSQKEINQDVDEAPLFGGETHLKHQEQFLEKNPQQFDMTGLALPGGGTDIDHKISFQMINQIMEKLQDISEQEIEDIEEAEPTENPQEEPKAKLELLIK